MRSTTPGLERVDDLGDRRWRHLLLRGQLAQGQRPFAIDDRERGEERGREAAVVLLAQEAREPETEYRRAGPRCVDPGSVVGGSSAGT